MEPKDVVEKLCAVIDAQIAHPQVAQYIARGGQEIVHEEVVELCRTAFGDSTRDWSPQTWTKVEAALLEVWRIALEEVPWRRLPSREPHPVLPQSRAVAYEGTSGWVFYHPHVRAWYWIDVYDAGPEACAQAGDNLDLIVAEASLVDVEPSVLKLLGMKE